MTFWEVHETRDPPPYNTAPSLLCLDERTTVHLLLHLLALHLPHPRLFGHRSVPLVFRRRRPLPLSAPAASSAVNLVDGDIDPASSLTKSGIPQPFRGHRSGSDLAGPMSPSTRVTADEAAGAERGKSRRRRSTRGRDRWPNRRWCGRCRPRRCSRRCTVGSGGKGSMAVQVLEDDLAGGGGDDVEVELLMRELAPSHWREDVLWNARCETWRGWSDWSVCMCAASCPGHDRIVCSYFEVSSFFILLPWAVESSSTTRRSRTSAAIAAIYVRRKQNAAIIKKRSSG